MNSFEDINPYAEPGAGQMSQAEKDLRLWATILHLSQLAGYLTVLTALAGWIAPIVIWQIKKSEIPGIEPHGKMVANWIISSFIYLVVSGVLSAFIIGIPLLIALLVMIVVFPVIGGIKANDGQVWKYPLTIEFIK